MKEVVAEFKKGPNIEVRKQKKLDMTEKKNLQKRRTTRKVYSKDVIWMNDRKF